MNAQQAMSDLADALNKTSWSSWQSTASFCGALDVANETLRAQDFESAEMDNAIAAGDGTLHGAIDYWQKRALAVEKRVAALEQKRREQFAMAAMQGDWAAQSKENGHWFTSDTGDKFLRASAQLYLRMADALIAELDK